MLKYIRNYAKKMRNYAKIFCTKLQVRGPQNAGEIYQVPYVLPKNLAIVKLGFYDSL